MIEVTLKVYNENGSKVDDTGKYYGFSEYTESYDAFSPDIASYCSIAKQFCYDSSKSQYEYVDDFNDMEFTEHQDKRIYAIPRKKYLSEVIFIALNRFGQNGGFQKVINKIQ